MSFEKYRSGGYTITMKRCFVCLKEFPDKLNMCPFCGNVHIPVPKQPIDLKPGTILINRYYLGRSTKSGGFGIVYKAYDMKLETVVAVKEFYPCNIVTRAEGTTDVIVSKKAYQEYKYRKSRFLAEARNLIKFGNHRNIPNAFEFFEANNTAYITMEFLDGEDLSSYLEQNNGKCTVDFAIHTINEVGNALMAMHKEGIIHKDIAPDNIYICNSGTEVKLLDLGAAKLKDYQEDVADITLKPGYSPPEQYDKTSKNIGWWSDVYALGATMYTILTGVKPEESTNRKIEDHVQYPHELNLAISENLSNTIMKAMAVDIHMRFKNVEDFLKAVNGEVEVIPVEKEKKKRKFRRFTGIAVAVAILIAVGFVITFIYDRKVDDQVLMPADIDMWVSVKDGSTEAMAVESITRQFHETYPDVNINVTAIPQSNYAAKIADAVSNNTLPELFESTDVSYEMLEEATDVSGIINSAQAKECLFLSQYYNYYDNSKKIPLGIEVPLAYIVTSGPTKIDFSDTYFRNLSDFNIDTIAVSSEYKELVYNAFDLTGYNVVGSKKFLHSSKNLCAVMLSSTMELDKVRETLTGYEKSCVYYDADKIRCKFTYEWSIGNGSEDEIKAAKRLLEWMLGNAYQNELMISRCNEGQIPINKMCFKEKISNKNLAPIENIYSKFVFEKETSDS